MPTTTFIDLFSGAGGLSRGLIDAGWTPLLATDSWADAAETYRNNFQSHPIIEEDIVELNDRKFNSALSEKPEWVVGGPPCQGFSTVGKRLRSDPRNEMVREFQRAVKSLQPEGFLLENVLGLRDMRFQAEIAELFEPLGYDVSFHVLRAANFGVPQLRRRVVFVGHKVQGFFNAPESTHSQGHEVSVWDAIGDLPALRPGEESTEYDKSPITSYQRRMRMGSRVLQGHVVSRHPRRLVKAISYIPDGGNRTAIPPRYQPGSGFHNSYSRLASWLPAVAVTSNMGKPSASRCIHPFQDRGLTAREGARLQSFQDRFHFAGGIVSQRLQVANAVPPLLAQRLGRALLDSTQWSSSPATPEVGSDQMHLEPRVAVAA